MLVGFTSSVAIVFQAAQSLGATPAQTASWMWALGWGMGLTTLLPSLWLRKPVMIAWSTPGAAVLAIAGASGGFGMAEATGAFIVCAALIIVAGATGWFERVMERIPMPLAGALLAGVLARFGLDAFARAPVRARPGAGDARRLPARAAPLAALRRRRRAGRRHRHRRRDRRARGGGVQWAFTVPVFTAPEFSWRAAVSLALPLFIVTMASQNLPGVAAIRAAGYRMPISKIITLTGVATLVLAPFGAFALNLAAITAAICLGREAHADPDRRWVAAAANGAIYCVVGVFGAAVAGLLAAFPRELVIAVAGLALLGTIGAGLAAALKDEAPPRGGADHLPGHALGRRAARRRLGVLGRRCRRDRALCATVAAPPRRTFRPRP